MSDLPMTPTERAQARFERFYAEREAERIQRGDPSPEQLGALEAKQVVRETRELEDLLR